MSPTLEQPAGIAHSGKLIYPRYMRFSSVLITGGMVASLCLSLSGFGQSTSGSDSQAPQQQPAASAPQAPASAAPAAPSQAAPSPAAPQTPAAPLKLESLPRDPHTPTPEEEAAIQAERARAHIQRLAVAQNNWGARNSTPGLTMALKETGRTKTADGTEVTYQITATGFAPGAKLTLLRWPLNQSITPLMDGVIISANGTAVCGGPEAGSCSKTLAANAPVELKVKAAKGEAIRIALTADPKNAAAASAVPFPLMSEDKGCKLQVLLGTKNAELVLIEGDGFKPDANFTLGSETYGVKQPLTAKPGADGHFAAAMTPWINGHDNGDTVIYYQSDTCTPTLSFHWGKDTYKTE